nr:hypothetical protein [Brevundimonas diminuta]
MKRLAALSALTMLAACGDADQQARENLTESTAELQEATANARALLPPEPTPVSLSDEDAGRVCRAAIASLNGRDPAIIRVISTNAGIHRVRYRRDDGTVWTNECRVGNGTAEWRAVMDGQPGRWRNEDTIRFTVDGSTINIQTFMGGEPVTNDTYEVN